MTNPHGGMPPVPIPICRIITLDMCTNQICIKGVNLSKQRMPITGKHHIVLYYPVKVVFWMVYAKALHHKI